MILPHLDLTQNHTQIFNNGKKSNKGHGQIWFRDGLCSFAVIKEFYLCHVSHTITTFYKFEYVCNVFSEKEHLNCGVNSALVTLLLSVTF